MVSFFNSLGASSGRRGNGAAAHRAAYIAASLADSRSSWTLYVSRVMTLAATMKSCGYEAFQMGRHVQVDDRACGGCDVFSRTAPEALAISVLESPRHGSLNSFGLQPRSARVARASQFR
jgi:hypothetical protein